jgi:hypothetical protein
MSTSNRATDDTVEIRGAAHVCPQSITANDMWLKNRSVPSDYLDFVLGSAGVTVIVRAIPADKLMNGTKSK